VEILGPIPFEDVLLAWALHEHHGKHCHLAAQRAALRPEQFPRLLSVSSLSIDGA
jgi:hypothetical protein